MLSAQPSRGVFHVSAWPESTDRKHLRFLSRRTESIFAFLVDGQKASSLFESTDRKHLRFELPGQSLTNEVLCKGSFMQDLVGVEGVLVVVVCVKVGGGGASFCEREACGE